MAGVSDAHLILEFYRSVVKILQLLNDLRCVALCVLIIDRF